MTIRTETNVRPGWYADARVPAEAAQGLRLRDIDRRHGLATTDFGIAPDGTLTSERDGLTLVDLGGRLVLPVLVDSHVHLDKAFIVRRTGLPEGGLVDAVKLSGADAANRSEQDLESRMSQALERAYANGTAAMRTHLDTPDMPHSSLPWQVFDRLRREWRGRVDLQAVALMALERVEHPEFEERCRQIAALGGVLGAFIPPRMVSPRQLDMLFGHADKAGLAVDFHVDETLDPAANGIEMICDSIGRTGYAGSVMAGHCCSLASRDAPDRDRIIDKIAAAGVHVVSLPHSNLFLQDRGAGATPLRRGITTVREMRARGASVHFASDNVQDPFYPYGDFDMIEVFRSAVRTAHLDRDIGEWANGLCRDAAVACGFGPYGRIAAGAPADLIICDARDWHDLVGRSFFDRLVLRSGAPVHPFSFSLRDVFATEYP